ncbi:MAG: C10 family peptidase [Muribaculaceae bacterium]|nr:C10 family peptidase [Muribaculaceae bacterium]
MKQRFFIVLLGCLGASIANSAPLTPADALRRVSESGGNKVISANKHASNLVYTIKDSNEFPMMYVFGNNESYAILSADDVAVPLLGYSDSGSFDYDNMSDQMKWWISEYERQISYGIRNNTRTSSQVVGVDPSWEAISPMIKTRWDQDSPYNDDCPSSNGRHAYTGCVATAMAQVMKYWNYPEKGTGRITYKCDRIGNRTLILNFDNQIFDWGNMLDKYEKGKYSEAEGAAVAQLMKCCGYGVQMNYGLSASGAQSSRIPEAFKTYFSYDKNCRIVNRDIYSVSEWNKIIYDNLKNVGPVIYNGQSINEGGHSFVCDGYDGKGFFHINWGWGGMSDGYFVLNALDPSSLGIGGGGGGFDFQQDAIIGIQPPNGDPAISEEIYLTQNGNLTATCSGNEISFALSGPEYPFWMSYNYGRMQMKFGAIFEPIEGTAGEPLYFESDLNPIAFSGYGSGIYQKAPSGAVISPKIKMVGLQNGKYKVTLASRIQDNTSSEWTPVRPIYGYSNFVYLTKAGNKYEVVDLLPLEMSVESFNLDTDLYDGCNAQFSIVMKNPSSVDLAQGIMPEIFIGGEKAFVGQSAMLVAGAEEALAVKLITRFDALTNAPKISGPTDVVIKLVNPITGVYYPNAVIDAVLKKNPGDPSLLMLNIEIDAPNENGVFTIKDKSKIDFSTTIKLAKGYFAYPLYAAVANEAGNVLVRQTLGEATTFMTSGNTYDFNCIVDFPGGVPGERYELYVAYIKDQILRVIGIPAYFTITDDSGVSSSLVDQNIVISYDKDLRELYVMAENGIKEIQAFDIAGFNVGISTSISENEAMLNLSNSTQSVTIIKVIDKLGNIHVKKLMQ